MKRYDSKSFIFGTLRGRLILSVAAIHAVMMTLFIVDLTARQGAMLLDRQIEETLALSHALSTSAAVWIVSNDVAGLQELVESLHRYPELLFAILTNDRGQVLAHTDKTKLGLFLVDLPSDRQETLFAKTPLLVDVAVPAMLGNHPVGWARVGIGQKTANNKMTEIILVGLLYALAAIIIGSLIAWRMAYLISRRLYAVQETIHKVRTEDPTARCTIGGIDEAAMIASEFNTLLDKLDAQNTALVKSETRYRLLLDNIRAAVVVHGADTRIRMSNPAAHELLGLSEEQLQGKAAVDPAWHFLREDSSRMPLSEYPVNRGLAEGRPVRDLIIGVCRPDQDTVTWSLANVEPTVDEDGEVDEIIVTFVDISRRKRVEEALAKREAELTEAQRLAHIGHWERDLQTNGISLSTEAYRIFGLPEEPRFRDLTLWHRQWAKLLHPEDRERILQAVADALESGSEYNEEFRAIRPSGEVCFIHSFAKIARDESGRPLRMFGTIQDITERRQAEETLNRLNEELEQRVLQRTAELENKTVELRDSKSALMNIVEDLHENTLQLEQANTKLKELDQLKSMFIASMSHELRTPLNSIIGFSSITLNEWTGPLNAEQKENIAAVLRSGKHLLSLINDVIDVSKIETGRIESNVEDFDVQEVVLEAVDTIKKDIENKGLELTVQTCPHVLHADRRRLLQCLLNLLSNAVKFTQEGSIKVIVEPSADQSMLTIAVADTGIGISEKDLEKLFSPFSRLHAVGEIIIPGTGLGLYLTQKLLQEILRGDIRVSSTYGVGSRFTLCIPTAG